MPVDIDVERVAMLARLALTEAVEDRLHAFLLISEGSARPSAERTDERFRAGEELPVAAGIPLALKDVLATRGLRTTAGSKILEPYVPPYDCTPWTRLKSSGGVL